LQGEGNPAGMDINFTAKIDDTSTTSNPFMPDRASLHLRCQHKEIARDRNRRVLGIMFREKLAQVFREVYGADSPRNFSCIGLTYSIGNGGEYPDPQKVPASSWLSAAYKHTMFIIRWPLDTKFPGPDFSFKELKNRELRMIVGPYLKRKLGAMYDDERPEGKEEEQVEFDILPWEKGELVHFLSLLSTHFNFSKIGSSGMTSTSESGQYR
jgi:hypothetical protein